MWTSTNLQAYQKQYDFTSSDQGKPTYTALTIEGIEFFNMVEQVDVENEDNQVFQTILCEKCGFQSCQSGNWVAIQELNDYVFFIPAFEEIKEEQVPGDYSPPFLLRQNGALWMTLFTYNNFKKYVPALNRLKEIQKMTSDELISLYKSDTHHNLFGTFPNFTAANKDPVLATSELNTKQLFDIIHSSLTNLERAQNYMIQEVKNEDIILSIYLNHKETTQWKALYKTGNEFGLLLGGKFKIVIS